MSDVKGGAPDRRQRTPPQRPTVLVGTTTCLAPGALASQGRLRSAVGPAAGAPGYP